jgi:tape measure domain-containing protein
MMEKDRRATEASIAQIKAWGATMGIAIAGGLVALGKSSFDAAVKFESLGTALTAVTGSAAQAKAELAQLAEMAKNPGLGFAETVKGALRLQSAGLSIETTSKLLVGFGNAVALAGKGKAELDLVTLALSQMAAAGKVNGQDLRQISEQIPQIREILKSAFGTEDTEILSKAQIPIKTLLELLSDATNRLPKMGDTLANTMMNAADKVEVAMSRMGKAITPVVKQLLDEFMPQLEKFSKDAEAKILKSREDAFVTATSTGDYSNTHGFTINEQRSLINRQLAFIRFGSVPTIMGGSGVVDEKAQAKNLDVRLQQLKQEQAFESEERRQRGTLNRERGQYDRIDVAARLNGINAAQEAIKAVGSASSMAELRQMLSDAKAIINKIPLVGTNDDVRKNLMTDLAAAKADDLKTLAKKQQDEWQKHLDTGRLHYSRSGS